jgi:lysyl-tRNA synthetase class 1
MFWCDQLVDRIETPQTINDSKTPSGRAHVGAMRGPLIHDAIYRALRAKNVPARYLFGVDDYDPLDEIPYGEAEHFKKYLGAPLCDVPPPPGSGASDMADYYISEFFGVFKELGIYPEFYRMRDIYRSGKFNEAIDAILKQADAVREIYRKVSGSERPANWYPFQVVCENCGRIGTTVVTGYDGKEVTYECHPNLVKWAQGCGFKGKMSPFDGRGKLPWKLEWCAKWRTFPVTIEGAGKDHSTKGGSRDVAAACLRKIFGQEPPLNCPYDFFLVGGAKMSSSKGVGVTAREMADFLPPEILRFLLIKPLPKHPVNFEPTETYITKLFSDFDRFQRKYYDDPQTAAGDKRVYELSEVESEPDYWTADFPLVSALIQMPHLDALKELEKRKGSPLTPLERSHIDRRIHAARYWLDRYADDSEKIALQPVMPQSAHQLSSAQAYFIHILSESLVHVKWEDDALQMAIFNAARLTPLPQSKAFQAIYRVLLDRDNGPKAGNLLSFLEPEFVLRRFAELPVNIFLFWAETSIGREEFEGWLSEHKGEIKDVAAELIFASVCAELPNALGRPLEVGSGVIEFLILTEDGKAHSKRVLFEPVKAADTSFDEAVSHFDSFARAWITELETRTAIPIVIKSAKTEHAPISQRIV